MYWPAAAAVVAGVVAAAVVVHGAEVVVPRDRRLRLARQR
jgi:hypothetical protein